MKIFEIQLGNSIGPVKLGMTETEVNNVIGTPDCIYGHRHHFLDGLMVDFDNEGRVEFIEAAGSELFSTTLLGFDVHRTLAANVLERIQLEGSYDHSDPELGYSYVFKELQLSFWRPTLPDLEEGEGLYFQSVAIASEGYFE
ncbi:hypothetical protein P3576_22605 [Vibrio parahaemolyticus]|uniref:hypothetical protein n=1 Tax=Vibrio parahaemolyticus TaxID=670 RepID=UPI0011223B7D|nr:hypothetical protein [Vibrio parahaemolyticus]EHH2535244.1 hypothetical protein [Vibrio parahaemolyticus]ELA8088846.1 hypothetical protein [Vibrio parahaemolyticus]ELA8205952.1 hypothetical protein [Vibrio parahaemolyticus]ELB2030899.1 hypothetical protein [Vibrio parahaemolyticus]ELB2142174.1 hypothetical protein [Vibrio parahaemolyticus]